ncbi:TetR/AcrR family transcriptional regulator [Nonomuraea sp. PA05]|nr:TetR/AcrR family transcriptional regulator [Nonomuraea sp. PA05]
MSPEQRREMIVRAALPLVVEYGTSVTTAQIARAAGIGEGTIFRAFGDKETLLAACMAEAARPDDTLAHVAAISLDLPLAERLEEAADTLRGYLARMGAVAGALAASGGLRREPGLLAGARPGQEAATGTSDARAGSTAGSSTSAGSSGTADGPSQGAAAPGGGGSPGGPVSGREASMAATREALTGLFEPEHDRLRAAPERLADAFAFMTMAVGRGGPSPLTSAELVDLFLNGALLKEGEQG